MQISLTPQDLIAQRAQSPAPFTLVTKLSLILLKESGGKQEIAKEFRWPTGLSPLRLTFPAHAKKRLLGLHFSLILSRNFSGDRAGNPPALSLAAAQQPRSLGGVEAGPTAGVSGGCW